MSTPITDDISMLNEAAKVRRNLNQDNHDRWSFAIYRCTYGNDATWDRLKDIITSRAHKEVRELGVPKILDGLEWTIFDDHRMFDHATTDFLREHFNQWKSAEWQPEMDDVDSDTEECDMPDLDFEPVEGCGEEDVGWTKVATKSICTELYSLLDDPEMGRVIYRRPPDVAVV
ncbi:hypothetical protein KC345_g8095 [Hortaea werneckii]|nr:hypothetical protein KC345_g8095 [Hortaea werneckii]